MPPQVPPSLEYARVFMIFVLLFFLYSSPDQGIPVGAPGEPHDYSAERVNRSRHALDILNTTSWQDFSPGTKGEGARYLNLTGFREKDQYDWERLKAFKERSELFSAEARWRRQPGKEKEGLEGEVYENVTGIVTGKWVRHTEDLNEEPRKRTMNLTETSPDIEWLYRDEESWQRNITGDEGKLLIRLDEGDDEELDLFAEPAKEDEVPSASVHVIKEVAATVTIQDESSPGDGWDMRVHGVHWPKQGVILLTTTSDKYLGIFGLPHLTLDANQFITSQKLLNISLEKAIEALENSVWVDPGNPWSTSPNVPGDSTMPIPHCEYIFYLQLYPLKLESSHMGSLNPATIVNQIEDELRFPTGAPIPHIPALQMSTVIFSPDCGFMLESKGPPGFSPKDSHHLTGKKREMFYQDAHAVLHTFAALIFAQILLLKMQSKEASTPSTVGRVSLYTIAMMLMADALLFSSLSLLSISWPNIFPSALLLSFAALMSVALGVRFIGAIYNVQEPERREALRARAAAEAVNAPARPTATAAPVLTAAGVDVPTVAVTPASTTTEPIIIPSDQDIDAEIASNTTPIAPLLPTTNTPATATQARPQSTSNFGTIYVRFILAMSFLLFTSLSALSWSVPIRTAYTHILSFTYLSLWLPQIHRNIVRNCRKALLWKFVIGQSILRLLPFAYFYLREDNILFSDTDWKAFCALVGWVWVQIWILAAQEILGSRWGLPKSWTAEGWDYHPILREDNIEAGGLPIGLVQLPSSPTLARTNTGDSVGATKKKEGGGSVREVDCAICMQVLEVPVVPAGEDAGSGAGGVVGLLNRRLYMVTPCRHVFHSVCLEGWMRFRLQCPICREALPPL